MSSKLTDIIKEKYNSTRETFNEIKKELNFRLQWAKEFAPDYLPRLATVKAKGNKSINWKDTGTTVAGILLPVAFGYSANGGVKNDLQKISNDKMIPAIEVSAAQPLNDATYVMDNNECGDLIHAQDFYHGQEVSVCPGDTIGKLETMFKEVNLLDSHGIKYTLEKGKDAVHFSNGFMIANGTPGYEGSIRIKELIINEGNKDNPIAKSSYIDVSVGGKHCNTSDVHTPPTHSTPTQQNDTVIVKVNCTDCNDDGIEGILQKKAEWDAAKAKGKAKQAEYQSKIDIIDNAIGDDCDKNKKQNNKPKNTFKLNDATVGPYISRTNDFLGGNHLEVGARWQPTGLSYSGPVLNVGFIAPLAEGQNHSLDENIDRSTGADAHFYNVTGDMNLVGVNASLGGSVKIGPFNMNLEGYVKVWKPTGVVQIDNLTSQNGYLNREEGLPFKLNKLLLEYGANLEVNIPLFKGLITPFVSVEYSANDLFGTPMRFDKVAGNSNTYFDNNGIKFNEFKSYNPWTEKLGVIIGFGALKQNQRTTHK